MEYLLLAGAALTREQRQDLLVRPFGKTGMSLQMGRGVADFALARQKHQNIPAVAAPQAGHLLGDGFGQVFVIRWRIAQLDRMAFARHLNHRRVVEMAGKLLRIQRGRCDDDLEIGALRCELSQIAEQKIDVQAAFMRFVDDDGVIAAQAPVMAQFVEQHPVGEQLDPGLRAGDILETHLPAHGLADLFADFLGHAFGQGPGGQTAWLGVRNLARTAAANFQTELGQLGGFTRAGGAAHDDHLMGLERLEDLAASLTDGQRFGVAPGQRNWVRIGV